MHDGIVGKKIWELLLDLEQAAVAAGVEADRTKLADGTALFAERFAECPVEIRTTSLPGHEREVSFRFVDEDARGELWPIARRWYRIEGEPAVFLNAVHERMAVRAEGIDADVRRGFRKVWAFLGLGYRAERFAALPGAPASLSRVLDVLEAHGVQHESIVGIDPANRTLNLYPMLAPGWASADRCKALARDLGLGAIPEDWWRHVERSVAGNLTLSWDRPNAVRFAWYRPAMTEAEWPDDPVLQGFARGCPVRAEQRATIPSVAVTEHGGYRKLEVDYDGRIVPVLVRCAQVPNEPG